MIFLKKYEIEKIFYDKERRFVFEENKFRFKFFQNLVRNFFCFRSSIISLRPVPIILLLSSFAKLFRLFLRNLATLKNSRFTCECKKKKNYKRLVLQSSINNKIKVWWWKMKLEKFKEKKKNIRDYSIYNKEKYRLFVKNKFRFRNTKLNENWRRAKFTSSKKKKTGSSTN